ncbi:MAG TPA: phosphoribosylglycinamide formyltransferase, partial [Pyrinomonadaceae bacterium]|nr:phosphoribosylglycinamide formyltransferase [Pyrinomonadaceae bacterium]
VRSGAIPDSEVVVVVSDKTGAEGLEKAKRRGIETVAVTRKGRTREEHDAEIIAELKRRGAELVCLAGYMRLLSADFVAAFPNRIVNIHPSLLPAFPGLDAQRQAIEYGVRVSGCTVHFVDDELDHGAIILQKAVEVAATDTAETLSAKILEHEHALYIEALQLIVRKNYKIVGRKVFYD